MKRTTNRSYKPKSWNSDRKHISWNDEWSNESSWESKTDYEIFDEETPKYGAIKSGETIQRLVSDQFMITISAVKGTYVSDVKIDAIKMRFSHDESKYVRKMIAEKDETIETLKAKLKEAEAKLTQ